MSARGPAASPRLANAGARIDLPGAAPTTLLLHGFTGSTSEVRPIAEALERRGLGVRAPLLRGHGTEPRDLAATRFDDWVAAAAVEVDALEREGAPFVLAGFSLGSLVAICLAARAPRGLVGLVLLGTALELPRAAAAAMWVLDRTGAPDWSPPKLWPPPLRDRSMRGALTSYDRSPLRAALEVYRGGRRAEAALASVRCPTLILHGAHDRVCPARNVTRVQRALPRDVPVRARTFDRSDHLLALDHDRREVADEVVAFVSGLGPASPP